jgi:hypothetical protein
VAARFTVSSSILELFFENNDVLFNGLALNDNVGDTVGSPLDGADDGMLV